MIIVTIGRVFVHRLNCNGSADQEPPDRMMDIRKTPGVAGVPYGNQQLNKGTMKNLDPSGQQRQMAGED
jgi:hypothetical protein